MENFTSILRSDTFLLVLAVLVIVLLIAFLITIIKFASVNKKYKKFMKKVGNGKNIEEDLRAYIQRVENIEKQNTDITKAIGNLETDLKSCIQKVGIVRYNAFKDTGSDLSFTLALLDEKNNGVVLNGIYSREMSNIYAKPVEAGASKYTLSEEENQAIRKAIESEEVYKIN